MQNISLDDLKAQNIKFPEVENPEPLFYELNDIEDEIFNKTIELIVQKFKYSRYTPLLPKYYKGDTDQPTQINTGKHGQIHEDPSCEETGKQFFAFTNSISRF